MTENNVGFSMESKNKHEMSSNMHSQASLPQATHEGDLHIGDAILPCAVLEDGRRVLHQEGFLTAIGRAGKAKGGQGAVEGNIAFLSANNLKSYLPDRLQKATSIIPFVTDKGRKAYGYDAELLPLVCEAYLAAREAGALQHNQLHIAQQCEILIRGFARVGIVALVDEATGYQDVRRKRALEQILDQYLSEERSKWAKRFPDEFYRQIFRLRGWSYSEAGFHKRPMVIGKYTEDIVYERLAPQVLDRLKQLNPRNDRGNRAAKHHQHLKEKAVKKLNEHLVGVIALMKASANWTSFTRMLERVYPKASDQLDMFIRDLEMNDVEELDDTL